jgi:hypothetical protein
MKCQDCVHWDLRGSPLRVHGYGLCKADPDPRFRGARTLSNENVCRIGRFELAKSGTLARRAQVLGVAA